jgi:hypothetical protein
MVRSKSCRLIRKKSVKTVVVAYSTGCVDSVFADVYDGGMDVEHIIGEVREAQEQSCLAGRAARAAHGAGALVLDTTTAVRGLLEEALEKIQRLTEPHVADSIALVDKAREGYGNAALTLSLLGGESQNRFLNVAAERALRSQKAVQTEEVTDMQYLPDLITTLVTSVAVASETTEKLLKTAYGGSTELLGAIDAGAQAQQQAEYYIGDLQQD